MGRRIFCHDVPVFCPTLIKDEEQEWKAGSFAALAQNCQEFRLDILALCSNVP